MTAKAESTKTESTSGNRKSQNVAHKTDQQEEKKAEEKKEEEKATLKNEKKQSISEKSDVTNQNKPITETKSKSEKTEKVNASSNQNTSEKPSSGNSSSAKPSHNHNWIAQKTTVQHPETGHNEQVLVKEAWTEYKPIYETVAIEVCDNCGADCTSDPVGHNKEHMLNGTGKYGWHTEYVQKQTGTETIIHPAEYTTKWVVDSPAWSEEVGTGYKCECGAKK